MANSIAHFHTISNVNLILIIVVPREFHIMSISQRHTGVGQCFVLLVGMSHVFLTKASKILLLLGYLISCVELKKRLSTRYHIVPYCVSSFVKIFKFHLWNNFFCKKKFLIFWWVFLQKINLIWLNLRFFMPLWNTENRCKIAAILVHYRVLKGNMRSRDRCFKAMANIN